MKSKFFLFVGIVFYSVLTSCGDGASKGLTISGNIQHANNLQVFFEKVGLLPTTQSLVLSKAQIDGSGDFKLSLPEAVSEGLYRLRVGQQSVTLIFDGSERSISMSGNLDQLNSYIYEVKGSRGSSNYLSTIQALIRQQPTIEGIMAVVDTTSNPLIGMLIAVQALGTDPSGLAIHQMASEKVAAKYPGSTYANDYQSLIMQIQIAAANVGSSSGYSFVEPASRKIAPDIILPNPAGKEYSLSSLKGKIVLLDFWASWCAPCRRENPHVVEVYHRYKNKGFTVYSVSMDGVDNGQAAAMAGDPQQLKMVQESAKESWKEAIKVDGLAWEYHVSDLKKWDCAPAQVYGVTSIPRTYMIDRDGKIAAINLRGAKQIEETLLKLL